MSLFGWGQGLVGRSAIIVVVLLELKAIKADTGRVQYIIVVVLLRLKAIKEDTCRSLISNNFVF